MENKIFSNDNGFIVENETDEYIKIMVKTMRSYDGIMDTDYKETQINYKSGLFQEWGYKYFAEYYDWCKDRNAVISHGKRMLEVK